MKINQIYNMDCLLGIQKMLEQGIQADLIVTDPPYFIKSTKAGGKSELAEHPAYERPACAKQTDRRH